LFCRRCSGCIRFKNDFVESCLFFFFFANQSFGENTHTQEHTHATQKQKYAHQTKKTTTGIGNSISLSTSWDSKQVFITRGHKQNQLFEGGRNMTTNVEHDSHSEGGDHSLSVLKRLQIADPALYIRRGVDQQRQFQRGLSSIQEQQQPSPSMLDAASQQQQHTEHRHKGNHNEAEPASGEGAQPMTGERATTRAMLPSTTTLDADASSQSFTSRGSSSSGSGDEVFVAFITGNVDDSSPLLPAPTSVPNNTGEYFTRKRTTKTSCEEDKDDASSKNSSGSGSGEEVFVAEIIGTKTSLPQLPAPSASTMWITPHQSTTTARRRGSHKKSRTSSGSHRSSNELHSSTPGST
jgi:hypothetical protein